uniref:Uncharacterized protein n=1 Tax=Anguilla anguilla TaxID=7936 RepID=A0A0E9SUH1_ANGAN
MCYLKAPLLSKLRHFSTSRGDMICNQLSRYAMSRKNSFKLYYDSTCCLVGRPQYL